MQAGIPKEHFVFTYNKCTACTPGYCSYRKEKDDDLRQITLVSLK
jgi:copper oxidase (laccase) domain-containing protein